MYCFVSTLLPFALGPLSKVMAFLDLSVRFTTKGSLERGSLIEPTVLTLMLRLVLFATRVVSGLLRQLTVTVTLAAASAKRGARPRSETGAKAAYIIITSIRAAAITSDSLLLNNTSCVHPPSDERGICPAGLRNAAKYEGLHALAQLPRTPPLRTSVNKGF